MGTPDSQTIATLETKVLMMVVGPSAIGKSTVMNRVVELDERFSRVKSFTTRAPRANDEPGQYFYLQPGEVAQLESAGQLVSQVKFPTTGQTYGTLLSSYPSAYNLLDTLANSVADYRQLPFESTVVINLTTDVKNWQKWFVARYPEPSQEARQRLAEAKLSISWSLANSTNSSWLVNHTDIDETASSLIGLATGQSSGDRGDHHGHAILDLIERGEVWPRK